MMPLVFANPGETQVIGNAGSGAPSTAGLAAWEVPAHVLQTPTPDYPPLCGSAEDNADHVDHQEKDHLFKILSLLILPFFRIPYPFRKSDQRRILREQLPDPFRRLLRAFRAGKADRRNAVEEFQR